MMTETLVINCILKLDLRRKNNAVDNFWCNLLHPIYIETWFEKKEQ